MSYLLIEFLLKIRPDDVMYHQVRDEFLLKDRLGRAKFFEKCALEPNFLTKAFYWEPAEDFLKRHDIHVSFRNLSMNTSDKGIVLAEEGQKAKEVLLECARIFSEVLTKEVLLEKYLGKLHP